ncbi:MAG: hypothetical protein ACD_75C01149G0002 [uncultured bacterium]|nr:MAG: hypothetical protein ACD_75C01149G0002 [uncultured bacterium]
MVADPFAGDPMFVEYRIGPGENLRRFPVTTGRHMQQGDLLMILLGNNEADMVDRSIGVFRPVDAEQHVFPAGQRLGTDPQGGGAAAVPDDGMGRFLGRPFKHPLQGVGGPPAEDDRIVTLGAFHQNILDLAVPFGTGLGHHLVDRHPVQAEKLFGLVDRFSGLDGQFSLDGAAGCIPHLTKSLCHIFVVPDADMQKGNLMVGNLVEKRA